MKILTTTVKCMLVMSFINAYTAKSQTIDYFGQTPPGDKAIEFAPGTFSRTDRLEAKIVFSPDGNECFYEIAEFKNNDFIYKIYFTKRENNTWTEQEEAPFSVNSSVELSCMSADGKKIYIVKENDIWMVDRTESGWGEPKKLLSPVNSSSIDGGYSETSDSVGYIFSNRRGVFGDNLDIWRIRHVNDTSLLADNLGYGINTINMEVTPCIAPDGSYLIFARSVNGSFKLFICFDTGNGEWTTPINMDLCGAGINT